MQHLDTLATILSFLLALWLARQADIKERNKARSARAEKEDRLFFLLGEFGLHEHQETEGPLMAEGIRRPRTNGRP